MVVNRFIAFLRIGSNRDTGDVTSPEVTDKKIFPALKTDKKRCRFCFV